MANDLVALNVTEVSWAEELYSLGWDDGLPVIPPTPDTVEKFCSAVGLSGELGLFRMPPSNRLATVRAVAANSVMAGAKPEYFPTILAALSAITEPEFNLHAVQCSTHVVTPLIILNGPIRHHIEINCAAGVFGPGPRSNVTIGRSVRLAMMNIGGARPGELDRSTLGNPAKISYCIGEREEVSPWSPLHVAMGFKPQDSVVTVFQAEAPHSVTNHLSSDPYEILSSIASTMSSMGHNNAWLMGKMVVVVGPEHAISLGDAGWARSDVQRYLYQRARISMSEFQFGRLGKERFYNRHWPVWFDRGSAEERWPVVESPDDIIVMVAGGDEGRFSAVIPGWGLRAVVSKVISADR